MGGKSGYTALGSELDLLGRLKRDDEAGKTIREKYLSGQEIVKELIGMVQFTDAPLRKEYVFLTRAARIETEMSSEEYKPRVDIATVLRDHKKWIDSGGEEGRRADLSGADLSGTYLRAAYLSRTDLSRTDLSRTDLSRANLDYANLDDADLSDSCLSGANLRAAHLRRANLRRADLTDAYLSLADLTDANLDDVLGWRRPSPVKK